MSDPKTNVDPTALFLGPQGQNGDRLERALLDALRDHVYWRRGLHPEDPDAVDPFRQQSERFRLTEARFESAERRLLARLKGSIPFHSPRYVGHMSSDTLIAAQVGYFGAMLYNANNVALDGSPATSELEDEVIADLCGLCGYDASAAWGTLCGGGTIANVHALWIYRNLYRTQAGADREQRFAVLVPATHHYSWVKAVDLLGFDAEALVPVAVDSELRLRMDALEQEMERARADGRRVLACVGVLGSTESGSIDPIDRIVALRDADRERFFVHVDAAYGGYARALLRDERGELRPYEAVAADVAMRRDVYDAFAAVSRVDGITIDPHKLGFVPYPAGALLLKSAEWPSACATRAHYLNAETRDHRGSFTLEGSRPGAAAAACWLAHRTVPLDRTGYGEILRASFLSARGFAELIDGRVVAAHRGAVLATPALDVVVYAFAPTTTPTLASVSAATARLLAERRAFTLASTTLTYDALGEALVPFLQNLGVHAAEWKPGASMHVLRSVMMTPFVSNPTLKAFYRERLIEEITSALGNVRYQAVTP